jgi:hypothetical protein
MVGMVEAKKCRCQKTVILRSWTFRGSGDFNKMTLGHPTLGTMMEHTPIAETPRDRFMRTVEKELVKFERKEVEFRKKDLEERAAQLKIPLSKDSQH